jgi:transposase
MPAGRLSMRKIREVLRLKYECGLTNRQIAKSCAVSRPAVAGYVRRAQAAGLSWPLPEMLDDATLERELFPPPILASTNTRPEPDWSEVHQQLKAHKSVTLSLLWEEYKACRQQGYQYSWFCEQYRTWRGQLDLAMRQEYRAGEKCFVDYAGQTIPIVTPKTGQIREAQLFVAVLGASNYTFAEATESQALPDWIGSHVRAFTYFHGVPAITVPDNCKTGVTHPHRYEPDLNPTYQDLASHYGTAIIPTRIMRPRDKAKVEAGVLIAERWILARLRNHTFFSLRELNAAIEPLLERLNAKDFKKLPGSRQSWFESVDRPALKPLPAYPYVYAEWKKARVNIDYHIEVQGHYYSVPYQLRQKQLDVRLTNSTVECFYKNNRLASHARSYHKGRHTTCREHMPKAHQQYLDWTPERLIRWAHKFGPATASVVETILASRIHPQQGFRSCLGILRLGKAYSQERLEAACHRAVRLDAYAYKSIESILKRGMDRQALPEEHKQVPLQQHGNIRGPEYYR